MGIETDEKLLEWLDTIEAKEATRKVYIAHFKKFCECVDKTPTELINDSISEVKEGKLPAERKAKLYVAKFKKCLLDQGYAPKSQQGALAALKSFFKSYDMPLSQSIARNKKVQALEENSGFMRREDVIKLVANAKNLREKAIILCMATSGMAVREIVDLKIKDIRIDDDGIGTVKVRREKSQADYITFISPEATIALKNYFDERNRDLKTTIKSDDDFAFVSYCRKGKTGQLNTITVCHIFQVMNDQLCFDNGTKSRSHALRKYFASTLEDNGFPKPKIDFMMGHTVSDLDKAYFNRDQNKLKELYKTFLPYLTFERVIEVRSLNSEDAKRLEVMDKENKELKAELENIRHDINARKGADDTLNKLFADPQVQELLLRKMKELEGKKK